MNLPHHILENISIKLTNENFKKANKLEYVRNEIFHVSVIVYFVEINKQLYRFLFITVSYDFQSLKKNIFCIFKQTTFNYFFT